MHSAIYLRKSRAEEHMSLEETLSRHRIALLTFGKTHGFEVAEADIYKEIVSGESLFTRPQMIRLMEAVRAGQYQAVLCMDMQRLGRGGMYDQGFILDTFKNAGTLIVTPERIYDLTKEPDEEAAEMQTFLSRSEYRMIVKRLRRGTLQSVQNGAYMANAPFGYQKTRIHQLPSLEIVPEEADCVRQMFQLYANGNGCTKIEQMVNAMGYHGRRGSPFNRNTIRQILDNPVYIGKIRWNKTSAIKSGIGREKTRKVIYNTQDNIQILDGHHPPIIDPDLWDAVQKRRKSRSFPVDSKCAANPLAGLVRCVECGSRMNLQGTNKGVAYLRCPTRSCCAGAKFYFVEQAILPLLEELTRNLKLEPAAQPAFSCLETSLAKMNRQAETLKGRRSRLYGLLEDGTYTRELFSQRMDLLQQEEAVLHGAIASLEEDIRQARHPEIPQPDSVLEYYQSASVLERKAILEAVISQIRYTKLKKTSPADFCLTIVLQRL